MQTRQILTTIDTHAGGEPLRIITGGVPPIPGATMLERRAYMRAHLDAIRRVLMFEPRGHRDMYGCLVTPPISSEAGLGVLFMHNEGYSTMCGHGVIALVTAALETGMLPVQEPITSVGLDTPAGLVRANADCRDGRVLRVSFTNVPSFVAARDLRLETEAEGPITVDLAFGGAFYAILPVERLRARVDLKDLPQLRRLSRQIKAAVDATHPLVHPLEPGLRGLYGTIFTEASKDPRAQVRNVTLFADAQVDRSPCGTGTCALMAVAQARGDLGLDTPFRSEGIVGTIFEGCLKSTVPLAGGTAVIPQITGSASITGFHQFVVEAEDPLPQGFLLD